MPEILNLSDIQNGTKKDSTTPKSLHTSFTGSPTSNTGYFSKDNHTIKQFFDNYRIALQTSVDDDVHGFVKEVLKFTTFSHYETNNLTKIVKNIDTQNTDQLNESLYGYQIGRPSSNKPFHTYMTNFRFIEPISSELIEKTVTLMNGLQLQEKHLSILNLNKWIDAIKANNPDHAYFFTTVQTNQIDVHIYQKAIPLNSFAFGVKGQINALNNYHIYYTLTGNDLSKVTNYQLCTLQNLPHDFETHLTDTMYFIINPFIDDSDTTEDFIHTYDEFYKTLTQFCQLFNLSRDNLQEHLYQQNVKDLYLDCIKTNQDIVEDIHLYFDILHHNFKQPDHSEKELSYLMVRLLGAIENINASDNVISINEMQNIYNQLKDLESKFQLSDMFMRKIQEVSMIMELNVKLAELAKQKNTLKSFKATNQVVHQQMIQATNFSAQQKQIIASEEPLIIGQAGAGSGKSHTILGRIEYLRLQGIDLNNVLVLSFTNVAAQNIIKRWPNVKSKTIASMIDEIYQENFEHGLSQAGTLVNAIRLVNVENDYFKNRQVDIKRLGNAKDALIGVLNAISLSYIRNSKRNQKSNNVLTKELSNIVSQYFGEVIELLNAVQQTTLELEPIIVLELMRKFPQNLKMPKKYKNIEFIITDESQDISAFEYILLLECVLYYKSQLLIVGDGSQTLYEFRSADPRCLSTLEGSGLFETYKLDTNYRSRQEILTYANQFLKAIDANKHANIQLHANKLDAVDMKSFRSRVKLTNLSREDLQEMEIKTRSDRIKYALQQTAVKNYIMDCLYANQQIAILAWTRAEKDAAKEELENIIAEFNEQKNYTVHDITSMRSAPVTYLSELAQLLDANKQMLQTYLNGFKTGSIKIETLLAILTLEWHKVLSSRIHSSSEYTNERMKKAVEGFIQQNSFVQLLELFQTNQIEFEYFLASCKQLMIDTEIKSNNLRAVYLQNQKSDVNYNEMRCIVSTIHGAKGLEFDNVIVFYDERTNSQALVKTRTVQEELRLFFVAFSRAKQTEWIINLHSKHVSASSADHGMFTTPIRTAYLKTLEELSTATNNLQMTQTN